MKQNTFIDLFQIEKGDELYMQFKHDSVIWHRSARDYWNQLYNKYKQYLDDNFPTKFPNEFLRSLWELKLISYLYSLKRGSFEEIIKGKVESPDFKWRADKRSYYIEAICPKKGSIKNYPYLNTQLSNVPIARDGTSGHREYRERLTGAFRQKAVCKYDPTLCDPAICNHGQHGRGYKDVIGENGYIIAISMADIDFINQPLNWRVDLSCFFPCSPYLTMDIDRSANIHDTYHSYSPSFVKGSYKDKEKISSISVDIFGNNKYAHVSAVIVSHFWQVLFPKLNQHERFLNFGISDNDFMLIHNPFALYPLDHGLLPVERELVATHHEDSFTIASISSASINS